MKLLRIRGVTQNLPGELLQVVLLSNYIDTYWGVAILELRIPIDSAEWNDRGF